MYKSDNTTWKQVPLSQWVIWHQPKEEMLWRDVALRQFRLFESIAASTGATVTVVSSHTSKSIKLPVVLLSYPGGCAIQIRDNFYNYKVTVWSPHHDVSLPAGIDGASKISECYCEGFPRGTVLTSHAKDRRRFTAEVTDPDLLRQLAHAVAGYSGLVS